MPKTPRPRVATSCPANSYAAPNERIIEFSNGRMTTDVYAGGLIGFRNMDDGHLKVDVYRLDPGIVVHVGDPQDFVGLKSSRTDEERADDSERATKIMDALRCSSQDAQRKVLEDETSPSDLHVIERFLERCAYADRKRQEAA
jgi:hypothetical protein